MARSAVSPCSGKMNERRAHLEGRSVMVGNACQTHDGYVHMKRHVSARKRKVKTTSHSSKMARRSQSVDDLTSLCTEEAHTVPPQPHHQPVLRSSARGSVSRSERDAEGQRQHPAQYAIPSRVVRPHGRFATRLSIGSKRLSVSSLDELAPRPSPKLPRDCSPSR